MERDSLKLTDEQKKALHDIGVVLCYMHGSVASGSAGKESDVDIAVLFEHLPKDTVAATTAVVEALHGFMPGRERDVAILNEASPLLKQAVASRGILLYDRSFDDTLRFQLRAMHEYEYSRDIARMGRDLAIARAQT